MTYCLGIKLKSGLIGLADTRLTSGTETTTAKKISIHQDEHHSMFIMTSGLRSVRDKAITYFQEVLEEKLGEFNKVYKAVNAFGEQLRRVAEEDRIPLERSGLHFNLYSIVGGQFRDDDEHKLYLLYPEGNWVEIGQNTPFVIIGNSGYGKPILNRTVQFESSIQHALKAGFLSFDSTRVSANDVDFPLDLVIYKNKSFHMSEHRFEKEDMAKVSEFWDQELQVALKNIPEEWMSPIFDKIPK